MSERRHSTLMETASSLQSMQNLRYLDLEVLLAAVQQSRCTVQVRTESIQAQVLYGHGFRRFCIVLTSLPLIMLTLYNFTNDSYHFYPVHVCALKSLIYVYMLTPLYSQCYTATCVSPQEAILREQGQENTCPNVNIRLKSKE